MCRGGFRRAESRRRTAEKRSWAAAPPACTERKGAGVVSAGHKGRLPAQGRQSLGQQCICIYKASASRAEESTTLLAIAAAGRAGQMGGGLTKMTSSQTKAVRTRNAGKHTHHSGGRQNRSVPSRREHGIQHRRCVHHVAARTETWGTGSSKERYRAVWAIRHRARTLQWQTAERESFLATIQVQH